MILKTCLISSSVCVHANTVCCVVITCCPCPPQLFMSSRYMKTTLHADWKGQILPSRYVDSHQAWGVNKWDVQTPPTEPPHLWKLMWKRCHDCEFASNDSHTNGRHPVQTPDKALAKVYLVCSYSWISIQLLHDGLWVNVWEGTQLRASCVLPRLFSAIELCFCTVLIALAGRLRNVCWTKPWMGFQMPRPSMVLCFVNLACSLLPSFFLVEEVLLFKNAS